MRTTPTNRIASHTRRLACALVVGVAGLAGCTHKIDVQPIKVEPIHMTLDINIKFERELDEFFDFEDRPATSVDPAEADADEPLAQPAAPQSPDLTREGGVP